MRRLQLFASVIAELVMTKTMYGDSIVRARRTSPMTLAAEIQWSLLPPLTFVELLDHASPVALEPAYEVAGDSLDYAVDAGMARFAVFDGMGHGIVSAQLISLVIAAYRNARRGGQSLTDTAAHIESAVNDVFGVESFATGLLCELDTDTGRAHLAQRRPPRTAAAARWTAGAGPGGRAAAAARPERGTVAPSTATAVGSEQLEPGDLLLLYTDGVTEARSPDGEFFGRNGSSTW